jgi:tripartite-type tricarboxylate transporter receptor subunit TctC
MRRFQRASVIVVSLLMSSLATAQGYPSKPIRWIVAYPAGGGAEIVTRVLTTNISAGLGQPIVIDSRGGASGNIGTEAAARAAPDGYTFLTTDNGIMTLNPLTYKTVPFNPLRDFQPVSLFAQNNFILAVNPQRMPVTDIAGFLAQVRANPGKVSYASLGPGGLTHVWTELLAKRAGLQMLHVPYKGFAPALQDLLGGQVDAIIVDYPSSRGFISSGKLRPLGVTMKVPHPKLPGVPSIQAGGVPDFEVFGWLGVVAPAGTPRAMVERVREEMAKVAPTVRAQYEDLGLLFTMTTPEEMAELIRRDMEQWRPIIKDINVQFD